MRKPKAGRHYAHNCEDGSTKTAEQVEETHQDCLQPESQESGIPRIVGNLIYLTSRTPDL